MASCATFRSAIDKFGQQPANQTDKKLFKMACRNAEESMDKRNLKVVLVNWEDQYQVIT